MKKITLLTAIAIIGFTVNSFGQESTANGSSTATVIAPLKITAVNTLAFGEVTEYGAGGTITVVAGSNTNTASAGGNAQVMGGTVSAGSFNVTGQANEIYQVTLPLDNVVTLTSVVPDAVPMKVQSFDTDLTDEKGTIGTNDTFHVGAVLHLNAGQKAATDYTGTYTVTVQYL
jgi:hypothetical protein